MTGPGDLLAGPAMTLLFHLSDIHFGLENNRALDWVKQEIAEKRLRALPFAVRCKDCEEAREVAEQRERQMAARRGSSSLFFDM